MPLPKRTGSGARALAVVELLLGLLAVLLALGLLFTGLTRMSRQARCTQLGTDLQAFAAVLEKSHAEAGRWPATGEEAGAVLRDRRWLAGSPVGGSYGWLPPAAAGRPGRITLTAFHPAFPLALTQTELRELDRRIDDGNLTTGRLRTGFNGWPVYLVGVNP